MRRIDKPEIGYFEVRLRKGGPPVGAMIWRPCTCTVSGPERHPWHEGCDRYPPLVALVDGEPAPINDVWHYGREIDALTYYRLVGDASHARMHEPEDPRANPHHAVNLRAEPPIF